MVAQGRRAGGLRRILRGIGCGALALCCVLVAVWGAGALWFQLPGGPLLRGLAIVPWSVAAALALRACLRPCRRWPALLVYAGLLVAMLGWWTTILPSQDRQWADDVAQPLRAQVQGRQVVIDNVRDFRWRSNSDYDIRWERREYDLDRLVSADLILSYWMGPAIAHTLVSFGFDDGRQLVFSLEIRKERGESFSAIGGFFRQFEAVLVAADERDIVRVRSNVRGEDVYLYRLQGLSQPELQELLLSYLQQADELRREPRFYNTLTSNCTTVVFELVRRIAPGLPLDYRLLLSGYLAEYAHDAKGLVPGYDFATLKARGRITDRARAAGDADDFSRAIRRGVPGIEQGSPR